MFACRTYPITGGWNEALRIIPNSVFEDAAARTRDAANGDQRLKSGGKSKYLLFGLLCCDVCGANYILGSASSYAHSGYMGRDCTNNVRVRRERVEAAILDPIRRELLAPERVERMAQEMRVIFAATLREQAVELQALNERIGRLRERLEAGDPDLEADEIQVAIERAEQKRKQLVDTQPAAKRSAKLLAMLPKAADTYRRQIELGLDNDPRAAGKARVILRKLLGNVRLIPDQGGLWAEYQLQPAALLKGVGTDGSGGWHCMQYRTD